VKKINKLLLCLGLFVTLFFPGCATTSKTLPVSAADPAELECRRTCRLMAICSGDPYNDHDILICGRECLSAHPAIRAAITECSMKWMKSCDEEKMNSCVKRKLKPLQQQ
jgi:hypothetical protein